MSLITKDTFVSATFIDQDRKNLEVLLNMDHTDAKTLTPHIIEASDLQADYRDLMKLTTMDQIHEETWAVKKAESEAFVEMAKQVMADSGVLEQETSLSKTKLFPTIVENILTNMENEDHLFALKLALFELQEIRESDNIEAKTALRKAQHKFEILEHAFRITGVRELREDVPAVSNPAENEKALDNQEFEIIKEAKMAPEKRPATVAKATAKAVAAKTANAKKLAAAKKTEAKK